MAEKTQKATVEIHSAVLESSGQNLLGFKAGVLTGVATKENSYLEEMQMMETVVERNNMIEAMRKVMANKGSAGFDNMTVKDLKPYLNKHWPTIKEELLSGQYKPNPVRKVEIPKPGGGVRQLGIPTVMDRLIGQALMQVLQEVFDPHFSDSSYGFRPKRSAHQAVLKMKEYVQEGREWVVDLDLEKFFDQVNHDMLMARVARRVKDKRVLKLIRRYLQAGIMSDGVVSVSTKGTPQGSPLSPLLSNILLDDLDKELEGRGHKFCRYADDCNIYVQTKRSGERVMASITNWIEKRLKLKVNEDKSAVDKTSKRKFLGYSMTNKQPRLKVAKVSIKRYKAKMQTMLRRGRGKNLATFIQELKPIIIGWINYFRLAETKSIFKELDSWMRHKLRCIIWRQLKRSHTRIKRLISRGVSKENAWRLSANGRGAWYNSGTYYMNIAYPKSYFEILGLVSLENYLQRIGRIS